MKPEHHTKFFHQLFTILLVAVMVSGHLQVFAEGEIEVYRLEKVSTNPIQEFPFSLDRDSIPIEEANWRKLSQDSLSIQSEEAWFVFNITLQDQNIDQGKLFLLAGSGANMEFWVPTDGSFTTFQSIKSGPLTTSSLVSVTIGNSWNTKIVFNPPANSFPVYVKANHIFHGPIILHPHIQTYESRLEAEQSSNLFLGIFYGVMLFLVVYHSFFFLILQDKTYAIHVLFMVSIVVFIAYHEGNTYEYLFPNSPFANYLLNFLLGIIPIAYILFYRSYLKLYKISSVRDRWFRRICSVNGLLQLIPFLLFLITGETSGIYILVHVINLVFILLYTGIFAGVFSLSDRHHLFLLGGLTAMVGSGLFATTSFILGNEVSWKVVIETGVLLESIIFAMGLGYRTRQRDQEKLKSSVQLVEQLKKNEELQSNFNQKLQSQVQERSQQLTEALSMAKQAAEVKSEFLTSMSHEMRTPLNGIIGLTNILQEAPNASAKVEHLDELNDSAHDLLQLVNNALDCSALDEEAVPTKEEFLLADSLSALSGTLGKRAIRKGLQFTIDTPQESILITTDRKRFEQILYNLTINAIKYTETGSIKIQIRLIQEVRGNTTLSFLLKDTGIGIPPEAMSQIFEPFQNQNNGFKRSKQGTGLGLSVVSKTLQLLGSKLEIESQPGIGSSFSFVLTTAGKVVSAPPENVRPTVEPAPLKGKKVLLVEDHKVNQKVGLKYLKKWGIDPDLAENGEIALAMVQQKRYDMVLMDLHMPVMDGMTATHQIKSLGGQYDDLPIIALSAATHLKEVQAQVLEAGMLDFVTKPFTPKDLRTKLETYLLSSPG